jgi:hypothetical protein
VQDLPDQSTQPVRDGANRLGMAEARDDPTVHDREDRPLGLHRGIGGLIEDARHLAIAFGAAVTAVHARTLLVTGAGANPGGEMPRGGKRRRGGADLRDDLLRGIDAEAGDFGEAPHRVVVGREKVGHLLIELAEVTLDHAQLFQRELQQPARRNCAMPSRCADVASALPSPSRLAAPRVRDVANER